MLEELDALYWGPKLKELEKDAEYLNREESMALLRKYMNPDV